MSAASVALPGQPRILDTLAQPVRFERAVKPPAGKTGQDVADGNPHRTNIKKRARAKFLTLPLARALAELGSELEKSYRNTMYCQSMIQETTAGQLSARYCGNRWCIVCNRIRTGKAMNKYDPILQQWEEGRQAYFVTLTVPNVTAEYLPGALRELVKVSGLCAKSIRARTGRPFLAVRKMECTYNHSADTYHPHLHMLVKGRAQAIAMQSAWLKRFPSADIRAQDIRPATKEQGGWRELFKYFTKIVFKDPRGMKRVVPADKLDVIFCAMRGLRVYQPVGFKLPGYDETDPLTDIATVMAPDPRGSAVRWEWSQAMADWIDYTTGEVLAQYDPSAKLRAFVAQAGPEPPP